MRQSALTSFPRLTLPLKTSKPTTVAGFTSADSNVLAGFSSTTGVASTATVSLVDLTAGYTAGALKSYTATIAGTEYSYNTTGQEADAAAVAQAFASSISGSGASLSLVGDNGSSYSFGATGAAAGVITFTSGTGTNHADIASLNSFTAPTLSGTSQNAPSLTAGLMSKLGSTANQTAVATQSVQTTATTQFSVKEVDNAGLTFQVGANEGDNMTINIEKMDSENLGVNSAKVNTRDAAASALTTVDKAINSVSAQRATLGAIQNRLDYKITNLNTSSQNLTSAESQIRDVDMAKEMTEFTNANILQQAATAMLAQANSLPQNVLSLIK